MADGYVLFCWKTNRTLIQCHSFIKSSDPDQVQATTKCLMAKRLVLM